MKALVLNGPGDIRYESFDDPKLSTDNGVILKVQKCSICGSDLHIFHGASLARYEAGQDTPKFCVGHEFVGQIVEVGSQVHTFNFGDRAFSSAGTGCGNCDLCKIGRWLECRRQTAFGVGPHLQGGQAEYVFVPNADTTLHKISDGLGDEMALLFTDALPTAYFGISRSEIPHGGTVAVIGLGPIGLLGVELAYLMGASQVFAIDPVAERRQHACALGAIAFAPGREAIGAVKDATMGRGVQSVFEASGASAAVESVTKFVAPGGTISMIGVPQTNATLPLDKMLGKNLTVRAGIAPVPALWPSVVPLVESGRLKAKNIFSHTYTLAEGPSAYKAFDEKEDGIVKAILSVE